MRGGGHPSGTAGAKPQRGTSGRDLLGAVIVEQASAYWGQLWEPCLLQSFSLDATHLWHFSAAPVRGGSSGEAVPGLGEPGPGRVGFRGLCCPQNACSARPSTTQSDEEAQSLSFCTEFLFNKHLQAADSSKLWRQLCAFASKSSSPPPGTCCTDPAPKMFRGTSAAVKCQRQPRVKGRAISQPPAEEARGTRGDTQPLPLQALRVSELMTGVRTV